MNLVPPITYQGGKQRIAAAIIDHIDHINPSKNQFFYDLCCGTGAITLELVNRGHDPTKIVMLDRGPWGLFWETIGNHTFNLDKFASFCQSVPRDRSQIKPYMQQLFDTPVDENAVYVFLLLQSSTFGGAAVWIDGNKWKKSGGFRNYWMPTETSNRRHPVNPMMPLPDTLFNRVKTIYDRMKGVGGICDNINQVTATAESIVYIDPPYGNTAFYGYTFDVVEYVKKISGPCYVSEGKPLSSKAFLLSAGQKKGGMSGERKLPHEEWLSCFGVA